MFIVLLRQPSQSDPGEMRSDPFWEFGSFGCTGCHSKNLLNPKRAARLKGARLAFAQGGRDGFRLVFVTPPVTVVERGKFVEVCWTPANMPFRYAKAPLLINNRGKRDFRFLMNRLIAVKRNSWVAKFASCFRAQTHPLPAAQSDDLIAVFDSSLRVATSGMIAACYIDALPNNPPRIDTHRRRTLRSLRGESTKCRPACPPPSTGVKNCTESQNPKSRRGVCK